MSEWETLGKFRRRADGEKEKEGFKPAVWKCAIAGVAPLSARLLPKNK